MTSPINLNKARKAKARTEKKARADENAIKFGRTKSEKAQDAQIAQTIKEKRDGHKRT